MFLEVLFGVIMYIRVRDSDHVISRPTFCHRKVDIYKNLGKYSMIWKQKYYRNSVTENKHS